MTSATHATRPALSDALRTHGFAFVEGTDMRGALEAFGALTDWTAFATSWQRLGLDTYMADGGRYRRRRHGVFTVAADGGVARAPHQPHYQSRAYNALNGGIERWFDPIEDDIASGASLTSVLAYCADTFGALSPEVGQWRAEVHQFRIEARPAEAGRPTPEGVHRDGVDYVLVLLVNRENIASGVTTIHELDGRTVGEFTLTAPCDAALVDDQRVAHGVTAVEPLDPTQPAYRDVLVVTFTAR